MSKTILLVDDASLIRSVASKAAEESGYNVIVAQDGSEGLEKIRQHKVDIVFSDVNMPNMGGLEMVAEIKKDPTFKFLPIVMLTTETNPNLKAQGKSLGVRAWLVKPFNKDKFLIALEKLLG